MPHTPGPWNYVEIESGEFIITHPDNPLHPALLPSVGKIGLNEDDARLTAAGPDLETAARLALPLLAAYRAINHKGHYNKQVKAADALEAALAKVDGSES